MGSEMLPAGCYIQAPSQYTRLCPTNEAYNVNKGRAGAKKSLNEIVNFLVIRKCKSIYNISRYFYISIPFILVP